MSARNVPGFYGKLPILGDFLSRRLPAPFVEAWDTWLQEALSTSRKQLGAAWLESYLYSPIWRFILSPGTCGPTAWAGIVMPSVDKVNRYFPFTLAVSIKAPHAIPSLFVAGAPWFAKVEQLALSALENDVDLEVFDRHLQEQTLDITLPIHGRQACRDDPAATTNRIVFPIDMDNSAQIAEACLQLSADLLATFLPAHSLWTTRGSEQMSPAFVVSDGLPPGAAYTGLLTGQWQRDAGHSLASLALPEREGQESGRVGAGDDPSR